MPNFELFANCILAAMLDWITKFFNVHQLQVLCDYCARFHWFQINQCWETFDHTQASPSPNCWILNFLQIASWWPYWIILQNCLMCINYRCCVIIVPGFIDFRYSSTEKPLITRRHLQVRNAEFWTFLQIASWRPYWIESQNCSMCINYRCCVIIVPGFIDFR